MLTDKAAKAAKAKPKPYKLYDRDALYLFVTAPSAMHPEGFKSWRYEYRLHGKRETLTYGRYPDLSLADVRELHAAARKLVAKGESPARAKQVRREQQKAAGKNTLQAVGERWYAAKAHARSTSWKENARRWLEQDVYPAIGSKVIQDVSADEIEALLRRVAKERGARSAHYVRLTLASIYGTKEVRKLKIGNPARDLTDLTKELLSNAPKGTPRGKPLPAKSIPALLEAIERSPARRQTKLAARLLLLTFTRKTELVSAPWAELDLERAQWEIPAERMKADQPFIVPLSAQAVECFKFLKPLAAGSEFVFPNLGSQDRPMGGTTLNKFFHDIGFPHFTPHSARSTASTVLNGRGFDRDAIELQLAHAERNRTRAAYNFADKMDERRRMMQHWADYLDGLESGVNVVSIKEGRAAA